jgi:hydroxyethylthiazole kinase-like uncharacterized protein yjeF
MTLLYRIAEIRAREALGRAHLPAGTLMKRAGTGAADWIHRWSQGRAGTSASVLVLCGSGDNGGDGFVCAEALARQGHRCLCWAPRPSGTHDAQAARARWTQAGGTCVELLPVDGDFDLAIDSLLGIGAQRPLEEPFLGALRWVQERGLPLVAMDVPSGLDADTGAWIGGVAGAPARHTLTFLGDKPGLHTLDGIEAAGAVEVLGLGLEELGVAAAASGQLNGPEHFAAFLRPRPINCNKGDFGTLAVVGGARGMVGAALLAARAALRLGAGKVVVDCVGAPELRVDPMQPELMFRSEPEFPEIDAAVAGCGLGTDAGARSRLERVLAGPARLVLDADALNCVAQDADLRSRLRARGADGKAATVLTPHPGEAARLLGSTTAAIQQDRVDSALALARQLGAIVVLKGAGSVIAEPTGRYTINGTGSPALASAGTGDVLAGMIGALLAQRDAGADATGAVRAAVWLHGRAADAFGADVGLTASEIAPLAARALSDLRRAPAAARGSR